MGSNRAEHAQRLRSGQTQTPRLAIDEESQASCAFAVIQIGAVLALIAIVTLIYFGVFTQ